MRREKFQRDKPVELQVAGLVNAAHAAFADLGDNLVVRHDAAFEAARFEQVACGLPGRASKTPPVESP